MRCIPNGGNMSKDTFTCPLRHKNKLKGRVKSTERVCEYRGWMSHRRYL